MPTYSFNCSAHGIFQDMMSWDEHIACNKKWKCPECGVYCERQWAGCAPAIIGQGKYYDMASRKAKGTQGMESLIDDTKQALKFESGISPYSKQTINNEHFEKQGKARRLTDSEVEKRKETVKQVMKEASSKMNSEETKKAGRRMDG